jgi:hypothetical protein
MLRFLPWKYIVQRAARAYGFADPALWLARIRNFAQPSEVQEPIELVRAGVLFHARGIVNAKAIQHNLDWVWPYWVERQFDPEDISFIPRAFSLSHINLTHRNWTAVGLPDLAIYSLVDPRGLVTPLHDGWSIDCWLCDKASNWLVPSQTHDELVEQQLALNTQQCVITKTHTGELALEQSAYMTLEEGQPVLAIDVQAKAPGGGAVVVAIRPYNPEGVQFIDEVRARDGASGWCVNARTEVQIDRPADQMFASDYERGDVFALIGNAAGSAQSAADHSHPMHVHCKVGMATAASVYQFNGEQAKLAIRVPLAKELAAMGHPKEFDPGITWPQIRSEAAELRVPNERMQMLYDCAVQTLVLLSADEIVPGPYTYRRFWFRDACLMMNALLALGLNARCLRAIDRFAARQLHNGYFRSQEGEWDSNGQVLWIIDRYESLTGKSLSGTILNSIEPAMRWIDRKRMRTNSDSLHEGLLPAGFSAEHLGPNDHYYWDDFWALAGVQAAQRIFTRAGKSAEAAAAEKMGAELQAAINRSIERIPPSRSQGGIPASPYRRIDAGAVGSLVADYPLMLYPPGEPRIMSTVESLMQTHFHRGGFFQDVIHSGINAYLTLDIAQTLLRAGDPRYQELMQAVARLATSTGQWPEAVHPHTLGGCMGDGQHGWAAAEWVMMVRNCFIREEGDCLIVGSGLLEDWLSSDDDVLFGPTQTPWGPVTIHIVRPSSDPMLSIEGRWRGTAPRIDLAIPGFRRLGNIDPTSAIRLERTAKCEEVGASIEAHGKAADNAQESPPSPQQGAWR